MAVKPNQSFAVSLAKQVQSIQATTPEKKPHKRPPAQQPQCRPTPSAPTPRRIPITRLQGFRQIACADGMDPTVMQQHPGRFHVACGLALSGMKQSAVQINLLPKQEGMFRRVTSLMRFGNAKSAWGLDLGISSLKAAKLVWNDSTQQAAIEAVAFIEHAKMLSHAGNEAEKTRLIFETFAKFLDSNDTKGHAICVGLPARMTLSRQIRVPSTDPPKIAKLVQFEATHQFSFPLEHLAWDYQVFDDNSSRNRGEKTPEKSGCRVLLMAVKKLMIQHLLEAFQQSGMSVHMIQTDSIALHNCLVHDYFRFPDNHTPARPNDALVALDVGSDVANIVVSTPDSFWAHSCGVGGHTFTRALMSGFNLPFFQAEKIKRMAESTGRQSDLHAVLKPVFEDLHVEMSNSLDAYAALHPNHVIQHFLGLGGGFLLPNLLQCLRVP